ncbi:hypothetical protein B0H16DRAFT_945806 [Mycena metata]|uniref:Uncharacterized protein n=1 Tax=Mycena metata TaxID=1033252 RepID=A0AAD7K2V3_9AGAR|nr:hypothetical protein B0H16DRAFT_945806 [Mycena metata]
MSSPILPPELEREIFERTAYMCPQDISSLFLVSQRVNEWIAGIRYRTVTPNGVHSSCPFRVLQRAIQSNSRPLSFFRAHVRHVVMSYSCIRDETSETVEQVFSAFSGIQHFVFTQQLAPFLLPVLASLRPRRFQAGFDPQLFVDTQLCESIFTCLTHLALWNLTSSMSDPSRCLSFFACTPSLTHLLINDAFDMVPHILAASESLQVLIDYDTVDTGSALDDAGSDDRFVLMENRGGLGEGNQGRIDYWARADLFVAKKWRGEIKPKTRCWIEKADNIPGYP